jgi:hypothetical protein
MVSWYFIERAFFLGDLGAQEVADGAWRLVLALDAGRHHLVVGCPHVVKLELGHQLENRAALHRDALRKLS